MCCGLRAGGAGVQTPSRPPPGSLLCAQGLPDGAAPWRPAQGAASYPAAQSSCDSSDCSYCQSLAAARQGANAGAVCWLRRKRSRTDLASMAGTGTQQQEQGGAETGQRRHEEGGCSDCAGAGGLSKQARWASMWDHALAEPSLVEAAVGRLEVRGGRRLGRGLWGKTVPSKAGLPPGAGATPARRCHYQGYTLSAVNGKEGLSRSAGLLMCAASQAGEGSSSSDEGCGSSGEGPAAYRPWSWDAAWSGRSTPPPARLCQVHWTLQQGLLCL